jgi:DNA ligase (NAD+)
VGGKPRDGFVKTPHSRPMLSLDNAYNEAELRAWDQRVRDALPSTEQVRYVCELKLDGLSLALHYAPAQTARATGARPDPRRRHYRRRRDLERAHHPLGAAAAWRRRS